MVEIGILSGLSSARRAPAKDKSTDRLLWNVDYARRLCVAPGHGLYGGCGSLVDAPVVNLGFLAAVRWSPRSAIWCESIASSTWLDCL